jgi:hypothetical protein
MVSIATKIYLCSPRLHRWGLALAYSYCTLVVLQRMIKLNSLELGGLYQCLGYNKIVVSSPHTCGLDYLPACIHISKWKHTIGLHYYSLDNSLMICVLAITLCRQIFMR